MANVHIDGDNLIVEIEWSDKLWALKSRLIIPLANVVGATADPGVITEPKGIRAPGAPLPGVITAGTFHIHGERSSGTSTTRPRPSSSNWPTNTSGRDHFLEGDRITAHGRDRSEVLDRGERHDGVRR